MTEPITITLGVPRERGAEAARLMPIGAVCAIVDWPLAPDDCETTLMPELARRLVRALAACGHVAFRYDEPDTSFALYAPPLPPLGGRLVESVRNLLGSGSDHCGVAVTASAQGAERLFDYGGWSYAQQAALAFDPASDPTPIIAAVRADLDWRDRALPAAARLLFGPGHDGAFAVLAAADVEWLRRFEAALA